MAAVGVDGDAQPRPELAEVRPRHYVREHSAPLVHLQRFVNLALSFSLKGLSLLLTWHVVPFSHSMEQVDLLA